MKERKMIKDLITWMAACAFISIACPSLHAGEDKTPFEYRDYAALLKAYVSDAGLVDYRGLKADREKLDAFVNRIARVDEDEFDRWDERKRIAFLINAYNALTLKVIIDHYPIRRTRDDAPEVSILQIPGAWKKIEFEVAGHDLTLDKIEHELLRKRFNEPRIHMALVCAALSCPNLRNEPYTRAGLEVQLDDQARRFLNHPKKFKIDRHEKAVYLSQIFSWFGDDFLKTYGTSEKFGGNFAGKSGGRDKRERAVLNFISRYVGREDASLLEKGEYEVKYLHYDWTLNEKK